MRLSAPTRRVHLVGFDQRDRRIGHAGALRQLALGQLVTRPNEAESPTDIDAHRKSLLQVFRIEQICPDVAQQNQWVAGAKKRTCCGFPSVARWYLELPAQELSVTLHQKPNTLQTDSFWMPFTANRQFKKAPRLFASAEGMHYTTVDGRKVIDGSAGLWCVNAGHGRRQIATAVERQSDEPRLRALVQHGPSAGVRFRRAARRDRAEGARPHLLHQFRL